MPHTGHLFVSAKYSPPIILVQGCSHPGLLKISSQRAGSRMPVLPNAILFHSYCEQVMMPDVFLLYLWVCRSCGGGTRQKIGRSDALHLFDSAFCPQASRQWLIWKSTASTPTVAPEITRLALRTMRNSCSMQKSVSRQLCHALSCAGLKHLALLLTSWQSPGCHSAPSCSADSQPTPQMCTSSGGLISVSPQWNQP